MGSATGSLNDASLSMTVDRAGSFNCPIGLETDFTALFFGLVGADLLEEAATRVGYPPVVFLFFSVTKVLSDTIKVKRPLTHLEKALREQASSIQEPSS